MKKIVLILAVSLGLNVAQMNAQAISGGVKANANMSNFLLTDMGNAESTMKIGASLGGFMKVEFSENFALQPELMFHYKSSEMKSSENKTDYEYWGAEIPIYAVGQMKMGNGKGFIGVGPYVGFGLDAKFKSGDIDLYGKDEATNKAEMNRWDFGVGAIIGYEFKNGFMINAGYQMGLIDNLDASKDYATMRPQTVSLGVGFKF